MNGRARGTDWFNCLKRSARPIGSIALCLLVSSSFVPVVAAQEDTATPEPFPRVFNAELRDSAERIYKLLNDLNARHVERSENILERAGNVLTRIADVTERRARQGDDISAAREAIAAAREKLDEARIAVRDQSERVYVVDDATDRSVRDRLRAVRDELHEDLSGVRVAVRDAIGAIRDAARALRLIRHATP